MLLKKISLKNYMGAENVEVDFSEKTEIRGKNRCGKSTLMNAYFDVMTGKFANGTAPTNICPVDENGEEKPVKEIERAITLEINGIEHEIRKVTKRKYRKGVFIGNETVYILDEPTTGLHSHDVARLIDVLQRIVDQEDTIIVIEHNLDVIKVADHIIDLGPEGGAGGGTIVVTGTPEKVAKCEKSYTGQFLKSML